MKEKIAKLESIKTKNFSAKDTAKSLKRQATDWEIIFVKHISEKGFVSKICEELLKFNNLKINNPI